MIRIRRHRPHFSTDTHTVYVGDYPTDTPVITHSEITSKRHNPYRLLNLYQETS